MRDSATVNAKPVCVGCKAANCTCTDDALDVVPLLLGYMSFEMAPTAGLAPARTDLKDLLLDAFAFVGL